MRWGGVRWGGASVATVGSVLAVASLLLALTWSHIFDAIIAQELKLSPGSQSYAEWVQPSVPLYFDVFLFNWTNAEDFPQEKPHLEEVGPFRFREYRQKVNITWHEDRGTVSYKTLRSWHWVEEGSGASLKDNITTLNVIVAAVGGFTSLSKVILKYLNIEEVFCGGPARRHREAAPRLSARSRLKAPVL